jgi:hypothetical protein
MRGTDGETEAGRPPVGAAGRQRPGSRKRSSAIVSQMFFADIT